MKKQLLVLIGLGLLLTTVSAYAQTINVKATIPFDFIVNRSTLPAGAYSLQSMGSDGRVLLVRSSDNRPEALLVTNRSESRQAAEKSKLVFHKYGDRYFLSQIWVAGNASGHQLPKSPRENEIAQDFSMQEVVLADLR